MAAKTQKKKAKLVLSVVTPAYNESPNLPLLYTRLKMSLDKLPLRWEWIVVDDHSTDRTYPLMEYLARKDRRVKVIRFARNSGSHLALACALREARGKCAVGMAADLQDPPEAIRELYHKWKGGAQVVWAVRSQREGESFGKIFFARLYYFIVRYGVGMKQIPPTGADFFLLDRPVLDRLAKAPIRNASLLLLISSFGFREEFITYVKRERLHGKSGWSLKKKLKLFFDSITMFSKAPLYWLPGTGIALMGLGAWMALVSGNRALLGLGGWIILALGAGLAATGAFLLKTRNSSMVPRFAIEKRSGRP